MNQVSNPSILYFGTPVVLISTINEDRSFNIAPISSVFWIGYRCMIGIAASSKTIENILREKECVLNLPSENQVEAVNCLALTTGSNPVPKSKLNKGYRYEPDKFKASGLTSCKAKLVKAPLINECPVQMEAVLKNVHPMSQDNGKIKADILCFELKILRVYTSPEIMKNGAENHIDPDKWRPLIMSFQKFYGLSNRLHHSKLSTIPEHLYRTSDTEEANFS